MLGVSLVRSLAVTLFASAFLGPRAEVPLQHQARAVNAHVLVTPEEERGIPMGPPAPWALALAPVTVECPNTQTTVRVRLYRDDGQIDPDALAVFVEGVSELATTHDINTRTVQLAVKAAYHFGGKKITVVSGYRHGTGPHGAGDALDFKLQGVSAAALAAYLRGMPRAGVGVYTNPGTQYVHVDDREQSFHWIDASPPGKTWREGRIGDRKRDERDASWAPEMDLPDPPKKT